MANNKGKKLTLNDIIAKRVLLEERKNKTLSIYIESLDGELEFKKPSEDLILDIVDRIDGVDLKSSDVLKEFDKLIYLTCPMLHNLDLQKEYGIVAGVDIVKELMNLKERTDIGKQIMEFSGAKIKETVKN